MHRLLLAFACIALVTAGDAEKPLDDVAVKLEPCDGFPYVEPGATGKVAFLFSNRSIRELALAWTSQVDLPAGKGPDLAEQLVLPAGGEKRIAMPDAVTARRGVVTFSWKLSDQDGRTLALIDRLGVMTLPGPETTHRAGFRFGWGTSLVHFVANRGEEQVMAVYARLGCDLLRVGDQWLSTRGPGDQYWDNQWANTGPTIEAAAQAGMDVLYVMWGTPGWAVRHGFSHEARVEELARSTRTDLGKMLPVRPPTLEAWRKRVQDTVGRYKDRVRYWEIWNDEDRYHDGGHHMPNGWVGSTDEYLELLRLSHREIKAIDPGLQVLNGGFFTVGTDRKHDLNPDLAQRVVGEAPDAFDILATLNDTAPAILLGPMAGLRQGMKQPKPLWITRVEQHGATPDELVRRLLAAKGCGANAFVWMWAQQFDSGYRGLLMPMSSWKTKQRTLLNQHSYFQMLPAGCAYVHAIGLLRMLPDAVRLDTGTAGQWVFAFADRATPGRQVVGLWREEQLPDASLRLSVGPQAVCALIDLYGNATPLPVADGVATLPLQRVPAYLSIDGGIAVQLVR